MSDFKSKLDDKMRTTESFNKSRNNILTPGSNISRVRLMSQSTARTKSN